MVTHFKDLESPRFDDTTASMQKINVSRPHVEDDDEDRAFASARVELKRLTLFLSAEQVNPKRILLNLVANKMLHLFLINDDALIQFFIPAVQE